MNILKAIIEDVKARRRGERRVKSRKLTGRVYASREVSGGTHAMRAKGTLTVDRRVYRANTGEWETLPQLRTEL